MPPPDSKTSGQARVDAIFQLAKKAQNDKTEEALAEAFRGHAPGSGQAASDPETLVSTETVKDETSPLD